VWLFCYNFFVNVWLSRFCFENESSVISNFWKQIVVRFRNLGCALYQGIQVKFSVCLLVKIVFESLACVLQPSAPYKWINTVRVNEHSDTNKQSEPAKHLETHPEHKFTWDILTSAHSWTKRKIKEAFYIARFNPVLNKQVQSFHLTLYPMGTGIT